MPRKRQAETYDDDDDDGGGGFVADAPKSKKSKVVIAKNGKVGEKEGKGGEKEEGGEEGLDVKRGKGEDGGEFWSVRFPVGWSCCRD